MTSECTVTISLGDTFVRYRATLDREETPTKAELLWEALVGAIKAVGPDRPLYVGAMVAFMIAERPCCPPCKHLKAEDVQRLARELIAKEAAFLDEADALASLWEDYDGAVDREIRACQEQGADATLEEQQ